MERRRGDDGKLVRTSVAHASRKQSKPRVKRNTYCTVHGQSRGETRSTSGVAGHTCIFPGVTRCHGVYRQQTDPSAGRDRYVGIIVRDRFAVQSPFDLNRRITLQHRAGCGDRVSPVRWFLTDHERSYLGGNYDEQTILNCLNCPCLSSTMNNTSTAQLDCP